MSIQKQFVLRYRGPEHLRFELPQVLCSAEMADALNARLSETDGVYRVQVYRGQRKLSIRYQETVVDFTALCKILFQIAGELEKEAARPKVVQIAKRRVKEKFQGLRISRWFSRKYEDAKETVQAAKIVTKGLSKPGKFFQDPEKMVIDFLNDILVLFLIRTHWDHITKEWIPKPLKYRYEWMAVSYMIYLLMRSRRPKK